MYSTWLLFDKTMHMGPTIQIGRKNPSKFSTIVISQPLSIPKLGAGSVTMAYPENCMKLLKKIIMGQIKQCYIVGKKDRI